MATVPNAIGVLMQYIHLHTILHMRFILVSVSISVSVSVNASLWFIAIDGDRLDIQVPTSHFCAGQESKSVSLSKSVSGNVNEPLQITY